MSSKLQEFKKDHLNNIHLHKPDINITDVKRTVVRAPQIITKKANIGTHSKDEEFDLLHQKLLTVEKSLNQLIKETNQNVKANQNMTKHCQEVLKQYEIIFEPSLSDKVDANGKVNSEDVLKTFEEKQEYEFAMNRKDLAEKYLQLITDVQPAINMELDLLKEKLIKTVEELLSMIKKIKKNCKERELELIDIDKYSSSLSKINNKIELTAKNEEQKMNLEQKLESATLKYTRLNDILKRELPFFFQMIGQLMHSLTDIVFWSYDTVSYQYFQTINLMKSDFGIAKDNFDLNEAINVSNDFTVKIKKVNDTISKLSIVNFSNAYLQSLASSNRTSFSSNSPRTLDDELASNTEKLTINSSNDEEEELEKIIPSAPTTPIKDNLGSQWDSISIYPKAIVEFSFNAQQDDDLSIVKGEEIEVLDKTKGSWWIGKKGDGTVGQFPSNYVKEI